jgi:hypothetical protein
LDAGLAAQVTPEGLETDLYALIEQIEIEGKERVEAFKAKGDSARIFADLSAEADTEFYLDDLLKLMKAFGVAVPDLKTSWVWYLWPDKVHVLREFSLGELKAVVQKGRWPDDAWSYTAVSRHEKLLNLLTILTIVMPVAGWVLSLIWPGFRPLATLLLVFAFVVMLLRGRYSLSGLVGRMIKKAFVKTTTA